MKKIISFFVIAVCLLFTIQLTSCGDKTDSPEVPEIPENPENPRDEAYYDSYIETVENLSSQLNNGTITTNGQLIEFAKNYDNFKSVTEQDGVVYLEFDGGWTYFVDFDGRTAVSPIAEEDIDFSEFDELLSDLEEFDNAEPEDDSRSDVQESRAATNPKYLPSKFKVLYWGPFDNGADASNCYGQVCKHLKYNIGTAYESVIDYEVIYGDQCSISDFSKFNDYDIVIFATHGCKGGMPLVPNTMKGISSLSDRLPKGWVQNIECTALDYNLLSKKLPALGNTVVWTLMCYSFCENSTMASVAKLKAAGDYFGATEPINGLINFKLFVPFIARLYRGASSADAFYPGGGQGYEYTFADGGKQINGVYGHNGFDGVCFPLTGADKAVDNSPVAAFQAPADELDKVLKGNGSFKAGIEVKNTSTSKINKIELTTDNISASSHKDWEQIIDRNKYTFKTDGLEDGTYEYRSYIEFPNGDIKYSSNFETFELLKGDYFELYFDEPDYIIMYVNKEVKIEGILNDDNKTIEFYSGSSYSDDQQAISFHTLLGLHHYKIYFSRELNYISLSSTSLCGGYIPQQVEIKVNNLYYLVESNRVQEVSSTEKGEYILTLPHVEVIGALQGNDLTKVDLSGCSNLRFIHSFAFEHCISLRTVNLTDCTNLNEIGYEPFKICTSLSSVNLNGCTNLKEIPFEAFKGLISLNSINFSGCSNLQIIHSSAFENCTSLRTVNLTGCTNLNEVRYNAFSQCSSLSSIDFSDCYKLASIGSEAFYHCSSLSSINFNGCSALKSINDKAFSDCNSLSSVDLSSCTDLEEIWKGAFSDCTSLSSVNLSRCTKLGYISGTSFQRCSSLSSVNLSDCTSLETISSFEECPSLYNVNLSGCTNLERIASHAFENTSLTTINLNGCTNLEGIGSKAFYKTPISSIDLSECHNLKEIGESAFQKTHLSSIDLSGCSNLRVIESKVFSDCIHLTKVTIPENIDGISSTAFLNSPVSKVYCYPTTPPYDLQYYEWYNRKYYPNPFPDDINNYAKIYVPAASVEIYKENWGVWDYSEGYNRRKCLNIFPM